MTAKLVAEQSPMTEYKTVMALDEELQEEITALNLVNEGSNPRRKSCMCYIFGGHIDSRSLINNLKKDHRALLTSMVHNRALRLHRPVRFIGVGKVSSQVLIYSLNNQFFMRGWREERYQPSCQKALRSAIAICHDLQGMVSEDINLEHLWFVTAYGVRLFFPFPLVAANLNHAGMFPLYQLGAVMTLFRKF